MKPRPDMPPLLNRLATLGDIVRLRIVRLLDRHELSVGELDRALQLPQSTVSRHLKLLHEGGWIIKRSEGTASLYHLVEDALAEDARQLWLIAKHQIGESPVLEEDDSRLAEVLAERREDSRAFFGRVGGEWDHLRHELFGMQFTAEALLAFVDADWTIADIGCGTGNAAEHLAPFVNKVIVVDREPTMLDAAGKRLEGFGNVEFRQGELTSLPIADDEVDGAMVFLVLHHVANPAEAMNDIARIVKPDGAIVIVDMVAHDRESYRYTMGHEHMGFAEETVARWCEALGLRSLRYQRLRPATTAKGPGLFVATMRM